MAARMTSDTGLFSTLATVASASAWSVGRQTVMAFNAAGEQQRIVVRRDADLVSEALSGPSTA